SRTAWTPTGLMVSQARRITIATSTVSSSSCESVEAKVDEGKSCLLLRPCGSHGLGGSSPTPHLELSGVNARRRSRNEDIGANQAESMAGGINDRQVRARSHA